VREALLNVGGEAADEVDAALLRGCVHRAREGHEILEALAAATSEMGVVAMRLLTIGMP
jgi:hypothetical protein